MGLRQLKKERTRQQIAESAWALFADRGFDRVTVAEVADAAVVSEATVFNYFRSKDDLFFFRLDQYGDDLVATLAARPAGESVSAAFRRLLSAPSGLVAQVDQGDAHALARLRNVNRVIAESPALLAREERSLRRTGDLLAALLLSEGGADTPSTRIAASVRAHALMSVQRALVMHVREAVLADEVPADLGPQVAALAAAAFGLLAEGLP